MLKITEKAIEKIKEIQDNQSTPSPYLRVGIRGGGCSGFMYSMEFANDKASMDKEFDFNELKVVVDTTSLMYLNECTVDYVETLTESGFKFDNPNVSRTCGCGQSFSPAED